MLKLPGRSRFLLLGILHRSCRGRCSPDRLQADCRLWWRSVAPLQNAETHSLHLDTTNNALHYGSDSLLLLYYIIAGAEKLDSTAHFSIVQINFNSDLLAQKAEWRRGPLCQAGKNNSWKQEELYDTTNYFAPLKPLYTGSFIKRSRFSGYQNFSTFVKLTQITNDVQHFTFISIV